MAMESSSLELKVMYCKDLKAFNFFQKLSVYAQASLAGDDPEKKLKENQRQQQRTPADKEGDGNPEWKHEMRFDLKEISFHDCDHVFIHFELKHEGAMFGDKTIGEVHVPFKDLVMGSNGIVRFVSYEVRNTEGKSNGVLSFSYKVNGNGTFIGSDSPEIDITGYPITHHHHHDQGSEIQHPPSDVHSSEPEIHYPVLNSPPQGVVYPPLESQNTPETPQGVQYSSPRWQHPHQESYYPQPDATYYPPPPPPPAFSYPPPGPPPPPPPHLAHGEIYHHHHHPHHHPHPHPHPHHHPSPGFNPWQPEPQMGFHSYSMPGTWDPAAAAAANAHPYENGETSPNGFRAGRRHHRSSSWNGR